jgi:hypothetical protein
MLAPSGRPDRSPPGAVDARRLQSYVTVFASQSDQPAREGPSADGSTELWTSIS